MTAFFAAVGVVVAIGGAATAKGRLQRAADLASLSAARSMRDDFSRLFVPALLPDGSVAEKSVSKTLAMRGVIVDVNELRAPTTAAYAAIAGKTDEIEGDDE